MELSHSQMTQRNGSYISNFGSKTEKDSDWLAVAIVATREVPLYSHGNEILTPGTWSNVSVCVCVCVCVGGCVCVCVGVGVCVSLSVLTVFFFSLYNSRRNE